MGLQPVSLQHRVSPANPCTEQSGNLPENVPRICTDSPSPDATCSFQGADK